MTVVRNMLCPIDLSECSATALRHALAFAALQGADVTVIAVRPPSARVALRGEALRRDPSPAAASRDAWEESVWTFVHDAAGAAHIRVLAVEGDVVPAILDAAVDQRADLIVMCTHGASGFDHMLLGSITERIISRSGCPVLAIPPLPRPGGAPTAGLQTILCGLDSTADARRVLDQAVTFAEWSRSRLVITHVRDDLESMRVLRPAHEADTDLRHEFERMIPAYLRTRCDVRVVMGHGAPQQELLRLADAWRADLIVVGRRTEGRSHGTAAQVLRGGTSSVLCVPLHWTPVRADRHRLVATTLG